MSDIGISIGLTGYQSYARDLKRVEKTTDSSAGKISSSVGRASGSFSGLKSAVSGIGSSLLSLINPATLAAAGIAGITAGIGSFVNAAAGLETTKAAFDVLTGSADTAASLLSELREEAAATPFELQEYQSAARNLLAFGTEAENVTGTLRRIGDISAGVGAPLTELSEIYGKIQVQGRIFNEDINQLTGRGIPIIQELAGQFGVTEDKIKGLVAAGNVGFPEIEKAFISLTAEGGKFNGLTQTLSETFEGRLSTLKSLFGELRVQIGQSFLPAAKDGLEFLIDGITALRDPTSDLSEVFGSVGEVLNEVRDQFGTLADTIQRSLVQAFGDASGSLESFGGFIKDVLIGAVEGLATAFQILVQGITFVIDLAGDIAAGFREVFGVFQSVGEVVFDLIDSIGGLFGLDISGFASSVVSNLSGVFSAFEKAGGAVGFFERTFLNLRATASGVIASIIASVRSIGEGLTDAGKGLIGFFEAIKNGNVGTALDSIAKGFAGFVDGAFSNVGNKATQAFKDAYNGVIFEATYADPPPIGIDLVLPEDEVTKTTQEITKKIGGEGSGGGVYIPISFESLEGGVNLGLDSLNTLTQSVDLLGASYTSTISNSERLRTEQQALAGEISNILQISQTGANGFLEFANSFGYVQGKALQLAESVKQLGAELKSSLVDAGLGALQTFGTTLGETLASSVGEAQRFGKALGQSFRETFRQVLPDLLNALGIVLIQSAPSLGFPLGLGAALAGVGLLAAGGFASARMKNAANAVSGGGPSFAAGSGSVSPSFAGSGTQAAQPQFQSTGLGATATRQEPVIVNRFFIDGREFTDQMITRMDTERELRGG